MDAFIVEGADKLNGKIVLKGAKNSVLPVLAACVLTKDEVIIEDCPKLSDIDDMLEIIASIGGKVSFDEGKICVCCKTIDPYTINRSLMKKIRSSIFILGPLVARCGEAKISMPGGCEIGARPIDLHINGLKKLGVSVVEADESGNRILTCKGRPQGGVVRLSYPSVGATENLMMSAALCGAKTTIYGSAKEPEIVDLARFLKALGANIYGAGSNTIVVEGRKVLGGTKFKPIKDRIVAGTYVAATAAVGGDVFLQNAKEEHLAAAVRKFVLAGVDVLKFSDGIRIVCNKKIKAIRQTVTLPYPGFPTDLQPLLVAAMCSASGKSVVTETLFENRFKFVYQLRQMGADIEINGKTITINGTDLHSAAVMAQDLRGGAALVVAALSASGTTTINGIEHIDRGYEHIEQELCGLGAAVQRIRNVT